MAIRYEKSISVDPSTFLHDDKLILSKQSHLEDLFVCSLCYDLYDGKNSSKLPKTLACLHSFCVSCINNWFNKSKEENNAFSCPICKQKSLTDPLELPTNRDILKLIEIRDKKPWVHNYHAACPSCSNVKTLEICFHCNQPVCSECLENHFGTWKDQESRKMNEIEKQLSAYLKNIDSLQHSVNNSTETIKKVELEIEHRYQTILTALNTEKTNLINSLNNFKSDLDKYDKFKQSLKQRVLNVRRVQSEIQKYEKNEMPIRKEKITALEEEFTASQSDYTEFSKRPFYVLEDLTHNTSSLLGELSLREMKLNQINSIREIVKTPVVALRTNESRCQSSSSLFQNLNTQLKDVLPRNASDSKCNNLNSEDYLKKFITSSKGDPEWEETIDHIPAHITSYKNLVYVCDDYGTLSTFEISSDVLLKKRPTQKLNFTNIRNISVNSKYLGVTFSCLTKDDIKKYHKKLPVSGICLFRRDDNRVCNDLDNFIKLPVSGGFISPRGLVLLEEHIFVSDKDLAKVYKLNYAGDIIQKYSFDGKIYDISLNSMFLIVSDYKAHELNLIDLNRMSLIKRVPIEQVNKFDDGPFNVELTKENLLFVNNSTRTEIYLYDINLNYKTTFSVKFSYLYNMTVLDSSNPLLIIGCRTNNNKYKLSCYSAK